MPTGVKSAARFWLLYFLFTIAVIGTAFIVTLYFPIYWLSGPVRRLRGAHDEVMRFGIGILLRVQPWLDLTADIRLPPRSRSRGVLLVSNHRSHLDVFILLSRIAGIRILAKSTLFKIPFLGLMMRASEQIRVERGRLDAWVKAMEDVRVKLRAGERVHIFPEMTRCPPGHKGLLPFTLGPFSAALQEEVMVIPIVFMDTDRTWPKGEMGLRFRKPVHVRTLPPLDSKQFQSAEDLRQAVYQTIENAVL